MAGRSRLNIVIPGFVRLPVEENGGKRRPRNGPRAVCWRRQGGFKEGLSGSLTSGRGAGFGIRTSLVAETGIEIHSGERGGNIRDRTGEVEVNSGTNTVKLVAE